MRGDARLATLVELVRDETRARRAARDVVLARLLEVLPIEALRAASDTSTSRGLVRGLADERLAVALRRMHATPGTTWTVAELAREAGLSRSVFFERFRRAISVSPMDYLSTWRLALASELRRRPGALVVEVAARVGDGSASAFSVAVGRHAGVPPASSARGVRAHATVAELSGRARAGASGRARTGP